MLLLLMWRLQVMTDCLSLHISESSSRKMFDLSVSSESPAEVEVLRHHIEAAQKPWSMCVDMKVQLQCIIPRHDTVRDVREKPCGPSGHARRISHPPTHPYAHGSPAKQERW